MKADLTNLNHYPVEKLLIALRKNDELVFPEHYYYLEHYPDYKKNCKVLLEDAGIDTTDVEGGDVFDYCKIQLKRLERVDFILAWRKDDSVSKIDADGEKTTIALLHNVYTLTAKGLDLVLKVEAHNDAERRHSDTHKHNTLMRWIAGSSFLLSLVAVGVSGYLAHIATQNMQFNQQRLEIQQQQIKKLSDKVIEKLPTKQPASVELKKPVSLKQQSQNE